MAGKKFANGEPKIHQTSLRYTDTVKKIVESYKGASFNERFENLCLDFKKSIPEREKKKKDLDDEIKKREEYLKSLQQKIQESETVKRKFKDFLFYIDQAKKSI